MSAGHTLHLPAATRAGSLALLLVLTGVFAGPAGAHKVHDHAAEEAAEKSPREHLGEFRETGDDSALQTVWAELEPTLGETANAELLLDGALVAQALHKFEQARALTDRVVRVQPGNDQAWLLANSIHLVLGDHAMAASACDQLRRSSALVVVTCHARTATEQQDAIRRRLENLLASPLVVSERPDLLAWSFSVAGDLGAATAQDYTALKHYKRSLEFSESTQVRSALVDTLLRLDRVSEAEEALASCSNALPLEVRRLIVAKRLGQAETSEIRHMDETFQAWMSADDFLHAREMARFYLDVVNDQQQAARLARINYGIQREVEDRRLLERSTS